jgi:hypothetical protein
MLRQFFPFLKCKGPGTARGKVPQKDRAYPNPVEHHRVQVEKRKNPADLPVFPFN